MESRVPPEGDVKTDTNRASPRGLRRYWKGAVGILAAFGLLGAVGTYLVNAIGPDVQEKLAGGGSIGIAVHEDPQGGSDGFRVATRSPAGLDTKLRNARDCDSLFDAAKKSGAVDVRRQIENLVLEGRTHRDVAIVDMRAKILRRDPLLTGATVSCASAGAIDAIGVGFDFDEPRPTARRIKDLSGHDLGAPYFARGNILTLKKGEVQPIQVVGLASRDYVEWEIEARAVIDGKEKDIRINNNGEPFHITGGPEGVEPSRVRYRRYYEWVWYETPQRLDISDRPRPVQ